MIVIPASLRSDFIHMAGMTIHIALESTIHIVGIRTTRDNRPSATKCSYASGQDGTEAPVGIQWAYEASSHHSTRSGITLACGAVPRKAFIAR